MGPAAGRGGALRLDERSRGTGIRPWRLQLPEELREPTLDELDERIASAFQDAYPDVPPEDLKHVARNFTQVVNGIIDIGRKVGGEGEHSHMDVANSFVYWCVANTRLDDLCSGEWDPALEDSRVARISPREKSMLMAEFVARAADWLLGMEALREFPELYGTFIRGAVALGTEGWERNRGKLE